MVAELLQNASICFSPRLSGFGTSKFFSCNSTKCPGTPGLSKSKMSPSNWNSANHKQSNKISHLCVKPPNEWDIGTNMCTRRVTSFFCLVKSFRWRVDCESLLVLRSWTAHCERPHGAREEIKQSQQSKEIVLGMLWDLIPCTNDSTYVCQNLCWLIIRSRAGFEGMVLLGKTTFLQHVGSSQSATRIFTRCVCSSPKVLWHSPCGIGWDFSFSNLQTAQA